MHHIIYIYIYISVDNLHKGVSIFALFVCLSVCCIFPSFSFNPSIPSLSLSLSPINTVSYVFYQSEIFYTPLLSICERVIIISCPIILQQRGHQSKETFSFKVTSNSVTKEHNRYSEYLEMDGDVNS